MKHGKKYVEAAKGTNLYYVVYQNETIDKKTGETIISRSFISPQLNDVIECQKQGGKQWHEQMDVMLKQRGDVNCDSQLLFVLKVGDLVYVPNNGESINAKSLNKTRIYKFVSCTGNESNYLPYSVANLIVDKVELGKLNKIGRALSGEMIQKVCIPLTIDRTGIITHINGKPL